MSQEPPEPVGLSRVGRQGLWYAAGMLITRGLSLLMLPVYTRYLTPADYGIIQLVELTFEVLSIIAGSRLAAGVFTYYHQTDAEPERRRMLASAFLLTAVLAVVVSAAAIVAAPALDRLVFGTTEHVLLFRLYAVGFAVTLASIVPWALIRLEERSRAYVGYNLLRTAIQTLCNVVFLAGFGLGVTSMVLGTVIASLIVAVPLWSVLLRRAGLAASGHWIRRHVRYSLPLVFSQISTFVLTFGDRYFLKAYGSEATVGLYSLSYQFGFLLQQVAYGPFATVWEPVRFAIARQQNRNELYARAFVYLNLILVTLATAISLGVQDVLRIMTTPAFHPAADIVPLLLAAYVLQSWTGVHDVGIHITERTEYATLSNWVSGALILAAYFALIPPLGALGAALATLFSFAVRWALIYRFSQRLWPVAYRWAPVRRMCGLAVVVVAATAVLPDLPLLPSMVIRTGLFLVYLAGLWYGGVLPPEERDALLRHPARLLGSLRERLNGASEAR